MCVGKTTNHPVVVCLFHDATVRALGANDVCDISDKLVALDDDLTEEKIQKCMLVYSDALNDAGAKKGRSDESATLRATLQIKDAELAQENREIKRLERKVDSLTSEKGMAEKEVSKWKKKCDSCETRLDAITLERDNLQDENDRLQEEISSLKRERPREHATRMTFAPQPQFQQQLPFPLYQNQAQYPMVAYMTPSFTTQPALPSPLPDEEHSAERPHKSRRNESTPKFCSNCGHKVSSKEPKFCGDCGQRL